MAKFNLKDKKDEIISEIKENQEFYLVNNDLLTAFRGGLKKILLKEFSKLDSSSARKYTKQLCMPINVLKKLVDKLSTIYAVEPDRTTKRASDRKLLEYYDEEMDFDAMFHSSNELFNAMKSVAIELYVDQDTNEIKRKVLPNNSFYVYSADQVNEEMDVFIKFAGEVKSLEEENAGENTMLLFMYSDDQFLAVDMEGNIRPEFMEGVEDGVNPFGVIPFTYINRDEFDIMPLEDTDTLAMTLAIPSMLTDLRYAIYFLSYSVTVVKNADIPEGFTIQPNAILPLKDAEGGDVQASVEILKGQVDIQQTNQFIMDSVNFWMESRGVKATAGGSPNAGNALSGISMMLQEADTAEDRKKQITFFKPAEKDFFDKLATIHNYLFDNNGLDEDTPQRKFSDDMVVETEFTPLAEDVQDELNDGVDEIEDNVTEE